MDHCFWKNSWNCPNMNWWEKSQFLQINNWSIVMIFRQEKTTNFKNITVTQFRQCSYGTSTTQNGSSARTRRYSSLSLSHCLYLPMLNPFLYCLPWSNRCSFFASSRWLCYCCRFLFFVSTDLVAELNPRLLSAPFFAAFADSARLWSSNQARAAPTV